MGEIDVTESQRGEEHRRFMKRLLNDVAALEYMLSNGMIEADERRIGAEQEMFLVNQNWRPAPLVMEILEEINDAHFTTELARFNLEFNIDPLSFGGDCLGRMENQLAEYYWKVCEAAERFHARPVLTGILPTLSRSDLGLEYLTPLPRYYALDESLKKLRGKNYQLHIKGTDELTIEHDSVMLEACNSSFQVHFQVTPNEFAHLYNIAQLVTAPLLSVCTNSPLLFGKQLWHETRIAVFQQAVDTRSTELHSREVQARVSFGQDWIRKSVLEIFREDIARFRVLFSVPEGEEPFAAIKAGRAPELKALRLHNGTIYRWNRPCYGIFEGKAHLRIENRVIPSGPTIPDEVANAALFFGLMSGISLEHTDITGLIDFDEVRANFIAAARLGLRAQFRWIDGKTIPAQELIRKKLIPLARHGLMSRGVDKGDIENYLGIIEERVNTEQTGSRWILKSLAGMEGQGHMSQRLAAVTAATVIRQQKMLPVHSWELARLEEAGEWKSSYQRVEQYMTTDLFTVHQDETVDLVAHLMDWQRIRHVPVEDNQQRLVGLVSYRSVLRYMAQKLVAAEQGLSIPVESIMTPNPIVVSPETPTSQAIELMRSHRIGCLPVVKGERLVGVVTERDFMEIARDLLEHQLKD